MTRGYLVLSLWLALCGVGRSEEPDRVQELVRRVLAAEGKTWEADKPAPIPPADVVEAPEDTRPVVDYYTAVLETDNPPFRSWCQPCNIQSQLLHDYHAEHGADALPVVLKYHRAKGAVPRFEWQGKDGKRYSRTGQRAMRDLIRTWRSTMDLPTEVKPAPAKTTTDSTYPIRGSWWSINEQHGLSADAVRQHLQQSHGNKFDPVWLAGLSREELHSLHSDDHEGRLQWAKVEMNSDQTKTSGRDYKPGPDAD